MPLDDCQTFKAEFLGKCAERGLSIEETHELVKSALAELEPLEKQAGGIAAWARDWVPGVGWLSDVTKGLATAGIPTVASGVGTGLLGGSILAGGLSGYGRAKLESLNDEDPEELKTRDKIREYRLASMRAQMQNHLRGLQRQNRPSRPML